MAGPKPFAAWDLAGDKRSAWPSAPVARGRRKIEGGALALDGEQDLPEASLGQAAPR